MKGFIKDSGNAISNMAKILIYFKKKIEAEVSEKHERTSYILKLDNPEDRIKDKRMTIIVKFFLVIFGSIVTFLILNYFAANGGMNSGVKFEFAYVIYSFAGIMFGVTTFWLFVVLKNITFSELGIEEKNTLFFFYIVPFLFFVIFFVILLFMILISKFDSIVH